jgi:hypothetical protein
LNSSIRPARSFGRFTPWKILPDLRAICHYDSISDSLGDDFRAKFEDACQLVDSNPERFHDDPSGSATRES